MILTRSFNLVILSLFCLVAMPATGALGATKKTAPVRPTISSVAPLQAGVGDQLTIKGRNLLGAKRATVFFKAGAKPAVAAKAVQATRTTIKVVIPNAVARYMTVKNGVTQPTRFRVRILARRLGKSFTALRLSPTIGTANAAGVAPGSSPVAPRAAAAADCDGDGVVDSVDGDDDNDLLSDTLEVSLNLNVCGMDSDGDGLEDGFEYQSALDLNRTVGQSLPYPGKRPYPNPLDGSDAGTDYDGDGLSAAQEHLMWKTFGARSLVLSYSAGLKKSVAGPVNDDFRDVDADLLGNWDEFNGRMTPAWWAAPPYSEVPYTESYQATSAIDRDSDGDGLRDGDDDTDHDLWTNFQEIDRSQGFRVQPFNPCLPDYSSPTCSEHPPASGSYPPFDAPLPPAPIAWP